MWLDPRVPLMSMSCIDITGTPSISFYLRVKGLMLADILQVAYGRDAH